MKRTLEMKKEIVDYSNQHTIEEAAKKYKVSPSTVFNYRKLNFGMTKTYHADQTETHPLGIKINTDRLELIRYKSLARALSQALASVL